MPLTSVSAVDDIMEAEAVKTEVKVKTVFNGEVMIHYLDNTIQYEELVKEIRGICRFGPEQVGSGDHEFPTLRRFLSLQRVAWESWWFDVPEKQCSDR